MQGATDNEGMWEGLQVTDSKRRIIRTAGLKK